MGGDDRMRNKILKFGIGFSVSSIIGMLVTAESSYARKIERSIEMTEFKKGDFILRDLMATEWQSRESAQQFVNYLHAKYRSNYYQLSPLRSTDWYDFLAIAELYPEVQVDVSTAEQLSEAIGIPIDQRNMPDLWVMCLEVFPK